jgi:hypothetical protein
MTPPPALLDFGVRVVRSITLRTGAMVGAAMPVAYALSAAMATLILGRPGPDVLAGTLFTLVLFGLLGAVIGGAIGWCIHYVVSVTALEGPPDRLAIGRVVTLAVVIAAIFGVDFARDVESRSRPRVMHSDRTVTRVDGESSLAPRVAAMRAYSRTARDEAAPSLRWRDRPLEIAFDRSTLTVSQTTGVVDMVSLEGLDNTTEVVATTGSLDGTREWLALLIRLRTTGRRDLLLLYDSTGVRVYQELLARTGPARNPVLWTAGPPGNVQEFAVNVSQPVRYILGK